MTGRLAGRRAVITGTASGQGRAAALLFAAEGAHVIGCDIDAEGDAETTALVRSAGGEMTSTAPLDLTDEAAVAAWAANVVTDGGVDILYANAAVTRFGPVADITLDEWHWNHAHEVDVVFLPVRALWHHLASRGGASVVLVGSTAGITGSVTNTRLAHTATKGAVVAMTRQLAAEGAAHGIRVNCVSPGMIATPQSAGNLLAPDHPMSSIARAIPLGRVGTPDDVAPVALFLASEEAGYITGQNLVVDGGWSSVLPG
ncbi:SDR family NAD(P)-dependent oxidoreductase [Georgenia sp. Z1491]|uniref:SDR family NAD(P)-dependent oxidoreductase n=1 Tax=Georgenia sp. Z1491 TaxID=3416707 RepID=UPI003CE9001A